MSDTEFIWAQQVDDNPVRWMGWFTTPEVPEGRSCRHRHHTEHAAIGCADARHRAVSRAERGPR